MNFKNWVLFRFGLPLITKVTKKGKANLMPDIRGNTL